MIKFKLLKELVLGVEEDALKFEERGNKAAGVRVRKAMQEIKNLATDIRKDIAKKNNEKKEA